MCLQALWWTQKLRILLDLTSIFAAIMVILERASQPTTMCCGMKMGLLLMNCRSLFTPCASPVLNALSLSHWCLQCGTLTVLLIEVGFTMIQLSGISLQLQHHLHHHHLQDHQWLLLMSSCTSCTLIWKTRCFSFEASPPLFIRRDRR